ncbi:MAG TPA: hypothetical protein VK886_01765 [Vicinamibacterales bacterium]|nr:hypothetical protein [Vicinamibacterales bacterium]
MWIGIGMSIVTLIVLAGFRMRRSGDPSDLGWVTKRWLAENRADQSGFPRS